MNHYIGIDLGTTNCSVAISRGELVEDKGVLQAVGEDLFESRNQLPSYLYLIGESEQSNFQNYPFINDLPGVCGLFAKQCSETQPARVVRSAKSWISLANHNSTNRILPFTSDKESNQCLSAVEVQSAYLRQIRLSLNTVFENNEQVVITVPASFSEFSRRLTLQSAEQAGIKNALLLEEPLAAFYNWLFYREHKTTNFSTVLVIDVGGGTTDFSLLRHEKGNWNRSAVGRHLLLGGDNLDLALAVQKEKQLNRKLHPDEFNQLISHCRSVKEDFLASDEEFRECTILS
ncbi:MAG: Hsp70 family protein, partial [bacterium]|nr:Hsp70 family protein [bacterium]